MNDLHVVLYGRFPKEVRTQFYYYPPIRLSWVENKLLVIDVYDSLIDLPKGSIYVIFPKTELPSLKKWVELIYLSTETEISNVWYKDKIEYGPKNKEAGCYYSITQTESQSIIDIKCGS